MQVNDLILKELLKRGYSLQGRTRVWDISDSKLWYLTPEQAQAYLDLVETQKYKEGIGPKELSLLKENMDSIIKELGKKPVNIIDLGCGNGKKAALLIENMKGRIKFRYCPIDISGYMVENAIENIKKLDAAEIVEFQWNISDFENLENITPLLRKSEYKRNLFLLLGNTLGNFEIHELLHEIRSGMRDGDLLLIGNGLDNHKVEEDIVKSCKENKGFDIFLSYIPLQLGLARDTIEYNVRFSNSRIEFYYTLLSNKTLKFQEKEVHFYKGDQIIVALAYQYKKEEFMSYLHMYFKNVKIYESSDGSYSLVLCTK